MTLAFVAFVCFATFVRASETTKYAVLSITAGGRSGASRLNCTGTGERSTTAESAASSPRSSRIAGCKPRTTSRRPESAAFRLAVGVSHKLLRGVEIRVELLGRLPELHREGDESLLCSVMQVSLDAPSLRFGAIDRCGSARRKDVVGNLGITVPMTEWRARAEEGSMIGDSSSVAGDVMSSPRCWSTAGCTSCLPS